MICAFNFWFDRIPFSCHSNWPKFNEAYPLTFFFPYLTFQHVYPDWTKDADCHSYRYFCHTAFFFGYTLKAISEAMIITFWVAHVFELQIAVILFSFQLVGRLLFYQAPKANWRLSIFNTAVHFSYSGYPKFVSIIDDIRRLNLDLR